MRAHNESRVAKAGSSSLHTTTEVRPRAAVAREEKDRGGVRGAERREGAARYSGRSDDVQARQQRDGFGDRQRRREQQWHEQQSSQEQGHGHSMRRASSSSGHHRETRLLQRRAERETRLRAAKVRTPGS